MSDQIRINGRVADGTIIVKFDGEEYYGFTEIGSYKTSIEEKLLWGLNKNRGPRARTRGVRKPEKVSLTGPLGTTRALKRALAAKSKTKKVGDAPDFLSTISYFDGDVVITDELIECRIVEDETKPPAAEAPDGAMETLTIQPMRIKKDGIEL